MILITGQDSHLKCLSYKLCLQSPKKEDSWNIKDTVKHNLTTKSYILSSHSSNILQEQIGGQSKHIQLLKSSYWCELSNECISSCSVISFGGQSSCLQLHKLHCFIFQANLNCHKFQNFGPKKTKKNLLLQYVEVDQCAYIQKLPSWLIAFEYEPKTILPLMVPKLL